MSKIKCLIVDDEPLARKLIADHIKNVSHWEVVGACKNAMEAYEQLMSLEVDVLFLDINMPVVNGTDFYRSLRNPPLLIFTTAYPNYAVEGFELDAVDYLVKPITFDRFLKAADKVQERMNLFHREPVQNDLSSKATDFLFIKHYSKLVKVNFEDVLYLEAQKDFVKFVTKKEELLAGMSMKQAEEQLPNSIFLRIHRSYIIAVPSVTAWFGNTIEIESIQLPIGASYREEVLKRLK